jgi:UDP-N-acetylglucosamine/UDP-N-acetylgalactosamine diphosphorylase
MYQELHDKLSKYGQQHLLKFWNELDSSRQENLAGQLNGIDWENLTAQIKRYVLKQPDAAIPHDLSPAPYFPLHPKESDLTELYKQAIAKGHELLHAGKVAALTVAGGQGSRLGYEGPKGTYPITPVKHKTLFQYFAESILRLNAKYDQEMNWYIMTSKLNDLQTKDFFEKNDYFGLNQDKVIFFTQGTMPAIGYDGKLLLAEKDSLALAPDGHGGTLLALKRSGALGRMRADGIDYISYFQVDNPLVSIVNPLFLGLHAIEESEMSAIMLAKTGPFEKLGNFCMSGGRLQIIEYSDLPEELAKAKHHDGSLKFIAGSPAIHIISRKFIETLTADGKLNLPWHRADKKVPFINSAGELVTPETQNAVKLESFIFDALPMATKSVVLEADREEEFAPTKNKTGVDSVESCQEMLIERDARRLKKGGVKVPRGKDGKPLIAIEISPRVAIDDEDVAAYCRSHGIEDLTSCHEGIYLS